MLQTADIFLLVAVSLERYKAICRPLSARHPIYLYLVAVIVLSVSLEIPRFFELEFDEDFNIWPTSLFEEIKYIRMNSLWNELLVRQYENRQSLHEMLYICFILGHQSFSNSRHDFLQCFYLQKNFPFLSVSLNGQHQTTEFCILLLIKR